MAAIKINKLLTIESNSSHTLLESMEQAGLEPEYNCRDGHCGVLVVVSSSLVKSSMLVLPWLIHKAMKFYLVSAVQKRHLR